MNRFISVALWLVVVSLAVTTYFGGFGSVHWWLTH
jgi:hypothetical protein